MTHTPLFRMAKMSDKTKRAINRGRRKAGLKAIRFKTRQKKVDTVMKKKGYLPKIKGYQKCDICDKKTVGSRGAWFQDFTGQKRICAKCIKKIKSKKN